MSRTFERDPQGGPDRRRPRPATRAAREDDELGGTDLEALQRAAGNAAVTRALDARTSERIEGRLGGGQPLASAVPGAEREEAPRPDTDGPDRSDVRVHDDAEAGELSRRLGAVAFTFGRDIFLADDAPPLESAEGRRVLRHELTHVAQQAGSAPGRPRRLSDPDGAAEQAAARAADGAEAGATAAPATVHRQAEEEEEELALLRADTVQRQPLEEEEEMVMTLPADTVHRQVEQEEEEVEAAEGGDTSVTLDEVVIESREMANPALAALFDTTVITRVDAALVHMEADPPEADDALAAMHAAMAGVRSLADAYRESDPALTSRLLVVGNAALGLALAIQPVAGVGPDLDYIRRNLGALVGELHELTPALH